MTFDDRVAAIKPFGFTDRQSRFLVTVMLHSGVCMVRQYCAFSRIVRGQKTQDFFGSLVARKYATVSLDAHRKLRLFHVQHRGLYEAIGEPHNRHRKPTPLKMTMRYAHLSPAFLSAEVGLLDPPAPPKAKSKRARKGPFKDGSGRGEGGEISEEKWLLR